MTQTLATAPSRNVCLPYALLALPIAIAGLPIYVQMPQFYAEHTGLSLTLLGLILLFVRLVDTVQDPLIGWLTDRWAGRSLSRPSQMLRALPFFLLGLMALLTPLAGYEAVWLVVSLIVLYTAFSFLAVNYYALGSALAHTQAGHARISSARETVVLVGILLGSVVPQLLGNQLGAASGFFYFGLGVAVLCMVFFPWALKILPAPVAIMQPSAPSAPWRVWKSAVKDSALRPIFLCYFANGVANALPATLILFYVADVLGAAEQSGYFLGAYFLSAIVGMPFWSRLASRIGAARSWALSMVIAAVSFVAAAFLGEGDHAWFYLVCVVSGACLGADMAMPPALLSQQLDTRQQDAGGYFGLYNFLFKLALACAAGIALPLLAQLGYTPQHASPQGTDALAYLYALIPSILKLGVAAMVLRAHFSLTR